MKKIYILISFLLLTCFAACIKEAAKPEPASEQRSVLEMLKNNYAFSMFYGALVRTGLDKTIVNNQDFTILVPDNDAFALSGITADSLKKMDNAVLKQLLSYHIVPQKITYNDIPQRIDYVYKSLDGANLYFSVLLRSSRDKVFHVNGQNIKVPDLKGSNGVLHAMEKVLSYPDRSIKSYLERRPEYSYFTRLLKQFGMLDQLDQPGPFVVLAPNNDSFNAYQIDEAALPEMTPERFQKVMLNAYLLKSQLFFNTDINDGAPQTPVELQLITPDIIVRFYHSSGKVYQIVGLPLNYLELENQLKDPLIYGTTGAVFKTTDHLALNGVVHELDGLIVVPDSVKIK